MIFLRGKKGYFYFLMFFLKLLSFLKQLFGVSSFHRPSLSICDSVCVFSRQLILFLNLSVSCPQPPVMTIPYYEGHNLILIVYIFLGDLDWELYSMLRDFKAPWDVYIRVKTLTFKYLRKVKEDRRKSNTVTDQKENVIMCENISTCPLFLSRSVEIIDIIYLNFCAGQAVEIHIQVPAAGGQFTWNRLYIEELFHHLTVTISSNSHRLLSSLFIRYLCLE